MKRIGIISKTTGESANDAASELAGWSLRRGMDIYMEERLAPSVPGTTGIDRTEMAETVDLIVVLGGDGTLLSVARLVVDKGIPILGVNLGGLGFLSEIAREELYTVMDRVLLGEFETDARMTLKAELFRGGRRLATYTVLNDAVINNGALARLIEMETHVDGSYLTTFRADGLILCTPTGSTAYNLAAGGAIVHPSLSCIGINPICPHTLTNRPILLPDSSVIELISRTRGAQAILSLDGQVHVTMEVDDMLRVQKGSNCVYLVKNPVRNFFSVLREKLQWGTR